MAMPNPSVMRHQFSRIPRADIPRSQFTRSHGHKTTFDSGYLIPIYWDEIYPADGANLRMTGFGRLATPLHPFMDNLFVDTFFFFVPSRLVWDNFQKFHGEQTDPGDSTDYLVPQIVSPAGGYAEQSIYDYLGIPTKVENLSHSALPLRCLNLIYNEWFRDQNLQDSLSVPKDDGPDDPALYSLFRRGKRHDYFTQCLPWPQKGPSVPLPIGDLAPIQGIGVDTGSSTNPNLQVDETARGTVTYTDSYRSSTTGNEFRIEADATNGDPQIYADLSAAIGGTVNEVRQAFQIAKIYERDARAGTRYTEVIRGHFGVLSPDQRLQRPEYLGGGSTPMRIQATIQTSESTASSPQGNLAAIGEVAFSGHGYTKSFVEHGYVIGLMMVRADLNYQQGLAREWSRQTRFDFMYPALVHIGEQAVLQKEIYASGVKAEDDTVFGYNPRYEELRHKPSQITGKFRSNAAQSLDTWHLAQDFANAPVLSSEFIEEDPPVERVVAVQDEPEIIMDMYFALNMARPIPMYGVPGLIDHF